MPGRVETACGFQVQTRRRCAGGIVRAAGAFLPEAAAASHVNRYRSDRAALGFQHGYVKKQWSVEIV